MTKKNNPLVSIIVITYNSANFVLETLESAKSQTYQNIELIISDDGSSDNTVEICKEWLKNNKESFVNTELITVEKNTGIPANCNRGVNASKGEWIKLIAGDDILTHDCLLKNISYVLKKPNVYIVFSKIKTFGDGIKQFSIRPSDGHKFHDESATNQFKIQLKGNLISYTPSSFIRKDLFNKIGMFNEDYKFIEDYPYWLNTTRNGFKLFFFDEVTVFYRVHTNSTHQNQLNISQKKIGGTRLRLIKVRQDLVYPYLSNIRRFKEYYEDFVAKVFFKFPYNSQFNKLYIFLTYYFNPFLWVLYVAKKVFKAKNIDYNF
jgi:alpha-1,3-rhamnosyltransferase